MALSLVSPIRHSWIVFLAETKRLVAYRAQFWFELVLSSLVEIVVAISVWQAVFQSSGSAVIRGYTIEEMVLYVIVAIFFGQATKGTGVGTFQREVYEGSLTKYLVFPLSVYSYKLGTYMPRALFAIGQLCLALFILHGIGSWPESVDLHFYNVVLASVSLFFSCLLYFFLIIALESFSFWADNVWALSYALQIAIVFLSGKVIPLDFFPTWLATLIEFTPFPYLVYFPVSIFLGNIEGMAIVQNLSILCLWVVVAYLASKVVMGQGLKRYTGVGQ